MTTYAAAIAARLQRTREDEDMIVNEDTNPELRVIREVGEQFDQLRARVIELERELAEARAEVERLANESVNVVGHADCYVAREVPWTDVAAGMMTLSREEHPRPWMVEGWVAAGTGAKLRNGDDTFVKTPAMGETVRVLVPYVTPEQAGALVKSELGGRV